MDSEIEEIVARFKLLKTTTARHAAYHHVIDELRAHEWRDVRERINGRTFQKDILGTVPLEIALQMIKYLNLSDVHSLRRVSKTWCELLSSDIACSFLLRLYTGHSLERPDINTKSTLTGYSKQRFRLERGLPLEPSVSTMFLGEHVERKMDHSSGMFAWLRLDQIHVYHERARRMRNFYTENRERCSEIRITESMVAVITKRGHFLAWDHEGKDNFSFRLPNTDISHFVASGYRFAVCFRDKASNGRGTCSIMHHDLQARKTHTVSDLHDLVLIRLNASSTQLITVCLARRDSQRADDAPKHCPHLRVVKYNLQEDGNVSDAGAYTRELPLPKVSGTLDVGIYHGPHDGSLYKTGVLFARLVADTLTPQYILPVAYDPRTDDVCVHKLPAQQTIDPLSFAEVENGLLYWLRNENGKKRIWISNPYAKTSLYPAGNMGYRSFHADREGEALNGRDSVVLMGGSQFVSVFDTKWLHIWDFGDIHQ